MKRRHLEVEITFFAYIAAAMASGLLALAAGTALHKYTPAFYLYSNSPELLIPLAVAAAFSLFPIFIGGGYQFGVFSFGRAFTRSLKSTAYMGSVWAVILLIAKNEISGSRYFFVLSLISFFVIMVLFWYIVPRVMIRNFYKTSSASYTAVITTARRAGKTVRTLKKDWARKIVGIGIAYRDFVFDADKKEEIDNVPVMADQGGILEWIRQQALDEVFICLDEDEISGMLPDIQEMMKMGLRIHLFLPWVDELDRSLNAIESGEYVPVILKELKYTSNGPFLSLNPPVMRIRYAIIKRTFDIIGGLIGTAITGIFYITVGLAIKLDSPGPVIFAQERIGKNGRRFRMYKFRSMYRDAEERKKDLMKENEVEGLMFKMKDDPRITRVGKFIRKTSIDEFPQFVNVLKGEMSLVGTRPPTAEEFSHYSSYHKRRLAMRPGITGLWQVSGRSDIKDFEEVVRLDCEYIDNWSIGLDMKILLKTVSVVFRHKGAS